MKCWYCNKSGNLKKDCWKRKEENDGFKMEEKTVDTGSGMVDEVLYFSNILQHQDEWILDSGAFHHMFLHRSWFSNYQPIDGGVFLMGNNSSCKIVGIGSIRIKMFDGVVKTLANVRHVLELKNNLISLVVLDFGGYKLSCQGGVLKVSKGIEGYKSWKPLQDRRGVLR